MDALEAMKMLRAALETAHNGLKFYRDRCPDAVDGSDDEADAEIEAAIAAGDAAIELAEKEKADASYSIGLTRQGSPHGEQRERVEPAIAGPIVAQAEQAQPVTCKGIPRRGCNYLARCDSVCNKCGEVHRHSQMVAAFTHPARTVSDEPALSEFTACDGYTISDPIERLRFFCSLAMKPQDWLDVEQFFTAIEESRE